MSDVANDISVLLSRDLQAFQRELELFPDDESVWRTVPGITNSAGNLAQHILGNLQYLIGTVLGGTGYVRDRDAEFGRSTKTRSELISEMESTRRIIRDVLSRLPADRLDAVFPEPVMGVTVRTRLLLLHLSVHLAYHMGQAGYLRRALTGENRTSGALPVRALAE